MNKQICITILCLSGMLMGYSQNNQGGRLTAMGNNGAAVKDAWGIAANPAGITEIRSAMLLLAYQKYFLTDELSSQAIGLIFPFKKYVFGLNLQRYGITDYNEIKAAIIFTKQFGDKLSIGSRFNYHQLKITDYGTATAIAVDVGAIYQLDEKLGFGLYFNNPSQAVYRTKSTSLVINTGAHIGIAYQSSSKLLIAGTLSYYFDKATDVAIGIDYKLIESLSLRAGISLKPIKQYVGIGFNTKKIRLDLALSNDSNLGYSPQITLNYVF